jgi:hypothetical protein
MDCLVRSGGMEKRKGKMKTRIRAGVTMVGWPLLAAGFLWAAVLAITAIRILSETGGRLIYSSDDVYIHMAMAKNLAIHGVWGVTPDGFTSSASSIAWPALIAICFRMVGVHELVPLAINILLSFLLLFMTDHFLGRRGAGPMRRFAVLCVVIFVVPLTPLVFNGMEHLLQILVFLAFAESSWGVMARPEPSRRQWAAFFTLACGMTLVRYEGLFLAGAAAVLLILRGRWRPGVGVVLAALVPVLAWAALSVPQGWYPIPNSVLIKSAPFSDIIVETPIMTLTRPFRYLTGRDYMLSFVILLVLGWLAARPGRESRCYIPGVFFLIVAAAHGTFINMEWFYRHAAYLVMLGIWALDAAWAEAAPLAWSGGKRGAFFCAGLLGLLLGYPFAVRAAGAAVNTPTASRNIYEMQYQMGLFLQKYYNGQAVAANDIGAIDYLADLHLLDLYGLASMDVARAKLSGNYEAGTIDRLAAQGQDRIAIVYDLWFVRTGLPVSWVKVEEWRFSDCFICGADSISFYAVDPAEAPALAAHLREFHAQLPPRVQVATIKR